MFLFLELDKSSQDIAAEGAILSEMLEIVAKRAALRPPPEPTSNSSLQSEPISLPVLPPQTTINPLLQHLHGFSSPSCYSSLMSGPRSIYTFPSQSHNQEHEVSSVSEIDFMFDGTEHYYLCTNELLLHDCHILMEIYKNIYVNNTHNPTHIPQLSNSDAHIKKQKFNPHVILVIVEFLVLYAAVLYFSLSRS